MSVHLKERPRAVLLGMMSTMPFGGVIWQTLHYLVGLERLGYETYYVEAHARTPRHFIRHVADDGAASAAAFIDGILGRFGFRDRWAFHALDSDGRCYGLGEAGLRDLYRRADILINLHGGTVPRPEHVAGDRFVCVVTDPVQLEMELRQRVPRSVRFFRAHTAVFNFGENHGHPDCLLPASDEFPMLPTRQPVVLDFWAGRDDGRRREFTTIANWFQPWRHVEYRGETYKWSKHLEFLKIVDLPRRTEQALELALSRCSDAHRRQLVANGWRVRDALAISADLDVYRDYIAGSRAEFTVAKDQNIRLRSGWFSDRSATYLAAGNPVVTQDTGFGNVLPTGEGLFAFADGDQAAAAIDAVNGDYPRHRRAAREIAREYFAHDVVLTELLERAGLGVPGRPRPADPGDCPRVLLVAHRFPPDARGGVECYTERLAAQLAAAGGAVHVFTRRPGEGPMRRHVECRDDGVVVHRLTGGKVRRDRFLADREACERHFRDVLAEADPDVVHVNHVLDLSPALLALAKERGAAVVLTLHDYYFACPRVILRTTEGAVCDGPRAGHACARSCFADEDPVSAQRWWLRALYFRRLLALADRLVAPSPHVARFFVRMGAPADRLRVVPNGIWIERPANGDDEASRSSPGPLDGRPLALGFLGAALPHKGLQVLLGALNHARLEQVDLSCFGPVGDAAFARELYDLAEQVPGLRFRMYGEYEADDLPLLVEDLDCVVVPSQWPETFCLVAREALARGIPVVAARMGALPDGIVDGVNGFVFEHDRADELAGILGRLARERDLLPQLREGARATAVPTLETHVAAIRDIYGEALRAVGDAGGPAPEALDELLALGQTLESCGFGAVEASAEDADGLPVPATFPSTTAGQVAHEHDRG